MSKTATLKPPTIITRWYRTSSHQKGRPRTFWRNIIHISKSMKIFHRSTLTMKLRKQNTETPRSQENAKHGTQRNNTDHPSRQSRDQGRTGNFKASVKLRLPGIVLFPGMQINLVSAHFRSPIYGEWSSFSQAVNSTGRGFVRALS